MHKFSLLIIGTLVLNFLPIQPLIKEGVTNFPRDSQFIDHGVAAPFATNRGIFATVDGNGDNVVLAWLFDHRGGYSLLMINATTGASKQFPMPFDIGGDAPYTSLLSSGDKLYTLFNGYFVEFDPKKEAFTFSHKVHRRMAMGMTEDDKGRIWAATYPNSGLVCFDPKTRRLTDYGYVHKENWPQYPRYVTADDQGWIYFATGFTKTQIIAFNPDTRIAKALLQTSERKRGMAYVYRDKDGKVYGQAKKGKGFAWYELYKGIIKKIGNSHRVNKKMILTGTQGIRLLDFPNGQRVKNVDLINRKLTVEIPGQGPHTVNFTYKTEGAWTLDVTASPDKQSIIGGSSFPMKLFKYDVSSNSWDYMDAYGQYNTLTTGVSHIFFGSYPGGNLIEWDSNKPFTDVNRGASANGNPKLLVKCSPVIHRPYRVLVYPDGKTVIMGGTPDYGYTGGGLLFYNVETGQHVLLTDTDIEVNQSTKSLTILNNGKILGGTTTAPGTGGEKKADLALLYIIDKNTKIVGWEKAVIPGVQTYTDLTTRKDSKVYGIADRRIFFVFDPKTKQVIYQKDVTNEFGYSIGGQSPRVFIKDNRGNIYVLFVNAIAKIDNESYNLILLDHAPQPITAGGAYLNKKIYYISGSHLFSYRL